MASPLLGYNTNVRHKGKLYHIQTEDSGLKHPHVITHLFADGGRIIASKKTSYAEHVGATDYAVTVKKMMQAQHKAMFIALRDGIYDEGDDAAPAAPAATAAAAEASATSATVDPAKDSRAEPAPAQAPSLPQAPAAAEPSAAEPAAAAPRPGASTAQPAPASRAVTTAQASPSPAKAAAATPGVGANRDQAAGRYTVTRPSEGGTRARKPSESIFGSDLLSEKSLDEVILSYLAEDLETED